MYSPSILALSGLVALASATAIPQHQHHHHHQRDIDYVWVTETAEEIITIPVTQTVWLEPGETAPAQSAYERPTFTSHIQQTVTIPSPSPSPESTDVAPSSTSESSVSVAPAPALTTSTTTSEYVPPPAPTTSTTSEYVPPAPPTTSSTSVYVAPTTDAPAPYVAPSSSAAPAAPSTAASSESSSSGMSSGLAAAGTSYTGDLTWYGVGMGACGLTSTPDQHIVAIAETTFDQYTPGGNPNNNPLCGKTVSITGVDGSTYTGTIVDRCTGCKNADLDLSEDFFNLVTNNGDGRVHDITWKYD